MLNQINDKTRTVLVIEDNELNREILFEILDPHYIVLQAENGQVGLDLLRSETRRISLILLDIQMPVMNGYEFLDEFVKTPSFLNIPIIVTTSSSSASDEIKCLENGAADFVSKPYNTDVVLKRVESMIRLSEASSIINMVEHDSLTGLYSHEFFYLNVDRMLEASPRPYDVLCCDVAPFKMLRGRYGPRRSDQLLLCIAQALQAICPEGSIFGRIGDSHFAALCPHHPEEDYQHYAEQLRTAVKSSPIPNAAVHLGLYASVDHSVSASTLCDCALIAIEEIRQQYGRSFAEYNEGLRSRLLRQQTVLGYMEAALDAGQFAVYYQPKHDLRSDRPGGAEALVRWHHPELGFISPGEFIPLFETSGFITALDFYVAERVCRDLREWIDAGMQVVPISLNLSRVDFGHPDLAQRIAALVDRYGVPRSLVHLEVTESAYTQNVERFLNTVTQLRDSGFHIELDDFGAGYSSLSVLNDLEMDVLKVDMSLVRDLHRSKVRLLLEHIFSIARSFGMEIVAEGVETELHVNELTQMGCTYAQGYYYARPLPKAEFEEYMKR